MQWHIWATSRWLLIISSIIKGLAGCGTRIAQQITRTGLGHQLYEAATTLSDDGIKQYLVGWRKELQNHLLSDPRRLIGRRYTMLVQHIGEDFPSVAVLRCYTEPVTSGSLGLAVTGTAWIPGCPDLLAFIRKMQPSFFSPFAYIRQKKELTSIQSLSFCAFSKRMQKACPPYLLQLLQLILTCIFFCTSLNAFMYLS